MAGRDAATDDRGMVSREEWAKSEVHKASRYACGWCGERFVTPHDFYDHLDAKHPKKGVKGHEHRT